MENFTLFQQNTKKIAAWFVVPLLMLCMSAASCSTVTGTARYAADKTKEIVAPREGRAEFDLQNGLRIYEQANVYTGEIVTRVHPNCNLEKSPSALFVPLGLVQESRDHYAVSQGVSHIVYESFLAEGTFSSLEYYEYGVPYRTEQLLSYAKEKGAEFLVGGLINQYFDGGATGDSRFSMQFFVYHVETGNLIWSLAHSGVLPYKADREFAVFTMKNRMPVNPMSSLISVVSREVALLLHYWSDPELMKLRQMKEDRENSWSGYIEPNAF